MLPSLSVSDNGGVQGAISQDPVGMQSRLVLVAEATARGKRPDGVPPLATCPRPIETHCLYDLIPSRPPKKKEKKRKKEEKHYGQAI